MRRLNSGSTPRRCESLAASSNRRRKKLFINGDFASRKKAQRNLRTGNCRTPFRRRRALRIFFAHGDDAAWFDVLGLDHIAAINPEVAATNPIGAAFPDQDLSASPTLTTILHAHFGFRLRPAAGTDRARTRPPTRCLAHDGAARDNRAITSTRRFVSCPISSILRTCSSSMIRASFAHECMEGWNARAVRRATWKFFLPNPHRINDGAYFAGRAGGFGPGIA